MNSFTPRRLITLQNDCFCLHFIHKTIFELKIESYLLVIDVTYNDGNNRCSLRRTRDRRQIRLYFGVIKTSKLTNIFFLYK